MKQRILALLLAVCLVIGIPAFAAEGDKMLTMDSDDGFGDPFESICSFGDTLYPDILCQFTWRGGLYVLADRL